MKSSTSTINARNQISVLKTVCDVLGVGPGDQLNYVIEGDTVQLIALKPIGRLYGMLKLEGPPLSLEGMDQGIAKGAART